MKLLLLSMLTSLGLLTACSGSNDADPTPAASGPFVAKVNGVQFTGDAALSTAKFTNSTKMLQIIGQTTGSKETIILNIWPMSPAYILKAGTYDFDPVHIARAEYSATGGYNMYQNGYVNWASNWDYVQNGRVVLESVTDTHVKGTFEFDAVKQNNNGTFDGSDVKKMTAGSFDLDLKKL